jgi:para-nitrobenzyl esterase
MPNWPTYDTGNRSTMMLDVNSHVERDPGGNARRALDSLPPYEYNVDRNSVVHG